MDTEKLINAQDSSCGKNLYNRTIKYVLIGLSHLFGIIFLIIAFSGAAVSSPSGVDSGLIITYLYYFFTALSVVVSLIGGIRKTILVIRHKEGFKSIKQNLLCFVAAIAAVAYIIVLFIYVAVTFGHIMAQF